MVGDKLSSMFNIKEHREHNSDRNEQFSPFLRKKNEISDSVNANLESLFKLNK